MNRYLALLVATLVVFLGQTFTASAAEDSTFEKPEEQKVDAPLPAVSLRAEALTDTNSLPLADHLEFSITHVAAATNDIADLANISLTRRTDDSPRTSLGRFLHKCVTQVEDFHPFKLFGGHNKFEPNFSAGFSHLTADDDGTAVTRGDNGTRQEPRAFLTLSSSIKF